MNWLYHFWRDERGQDLIEYSMIITFVLLTCLVAISTGAPYINSMWTAETTQLVAANTFIH